MRSSRLREYLSEPRPPETPHLLAERQEWAAVRALLDGIDCLPAEEAAGRLDALRASHDHLDRRAAALAGLRPDARGFLDVPLARHADPSTTADPPYESGRMIGRYQVQSIIGEGGMGRVYRAEDTRLLRTVAIKVLTAHRVRGATLLREAQMAARLQHRNIATVHDVLEFDDRLHIVMEFLGGQSLHRLLAHEAVTADRIVDIFSATLAAVGHAHRNGVIHCDLKPANIQVLAQDEVKVLDFGLARLDRAGADGATSMDVAGTPRYLAPERLRGVHPNARTDIYSLGVILSEMLRHHSLAPAKSGVETVAVGDRQRVVHAKLRRIADRSTAHEPGSRFASVDEMVIALEADPETGVEPPPRPPIWWPAVATALTSMVMLLVWLLSWTGHLSAAPPVLAVSMGAAGTDAMSAYVAAAVTQVLEHAMGSTRDITLARPDTSRPDAPTDPAELGATHVLGGRVERDGTDIRIDLTVTTRDGALLASSRVATSLAALGDLGPALVNGVDTLLGRARLPVDRRTLEEAARRQTISFQPEAFEDYAQAREYMRTSGDVAGALDHAIGLLDRAIARDGAFALAHAGLAEAYWLKYLQTKENQWTNRARSAALDALRLNPDDPIVRYSLAIIYAGTGAQDTALIEVSKAIALQPTNDDLYRLRGRLHAESGRLERGLLDLRRAMALRPGYWENPRQAGLLLFQAGRFDEAVTYFQRVTELRPSNATAFQNLGTVLQAADRGDEALAAYEKALAIAPNANTYSNIGMLHHEGGRYEDARRAYEESIRLQPRSAITHRNLGDALSKRGDRAGAEAAWERAIVLTGDQLQVNPKDFDALSLQALCLAKLGRGAEARGLVERVLAQSPLPATARYRSGVALVLLGDPAGVQVVRDAIAAGYSKAVAARDDDLAAVREAVGR